MFQEKAFFMRPEVLQNRLYS